MHPFVSYILHVNPTYLHPFYKLTYMYYTYIRKLPIHATPITVILLTNKSNFDKLKIYHNNESNKNLINQLF